MKGTASRAFALLGISLVVGVASAGAQGRISVDIPFDFIVAGSVLPAGTYEVSPVFADGVALQIRSHDCKSGVVFLATNVYANREETPRMVFHKYGSRYFLNQLWMDGSGIGHQLPKTRAEMELALQDKDNRPVVLAAQAR